MKSVRNYKGNMLLIELVLVLIFFSLSQAVVLQAFALAQQKTADSRATNAALSMAQDVAEVVSAAERPDAALLSLRFAGEDGRYVYVDENGFDLYADVQREDAAGGVLYTVSLRAERAGRVLFTFPAARYAEVSP